MTAPACLPAWVLRARRHAETARELDEIAATLDEGILGIWPGMLGSCIARLRALAEAERRERDRLMQLQERADA